MAKTDWLLIVGGIVVLGAAYLYFAGGKALQHDVGEAGHLLTQPGYKPNPNLGYGEDY